MIDWVIEHWKTLVLVTVVTALIWVWAEGESVTTADIAGVRVVFPSSVPGDEDGGEGVVYTVDRGWNGMARLELEGSTRGLDRARQRLIMPVELVGGKGGVPTVAGQYRVDLRQAINASAALEGLGVNVVEAEPRYVQVEVIELVTRRVGVRVVLPEHVRLAAEAKVEPATVVVRVPKTEAVMGVLGEGEGLVAPAVVEEASLAVLSAGREGVVTARVQMPERLRRVLGGGMGWVEVIGGEGEAHGGGLEVTLTLRAEQDSVTKATVPVWVAMPAGAAGQWAVEVEPAFLTDVTVAGPEEVIERIRSDELKVIGYVKVLASELAGAGVGGASGSGEAVGNGSEEVDQGGEDDAGGLVKPVVFFDLPAGVSVSAAGQMVRIRVIGRKDGE